MLYDNLFSARWQLLSQSASRNEINLFSFEASSLFHLRNRQKHTSRIHANSLLCISVTKLKKK